MSFQTTVLARLTALTNLVNGIITNGKTNEELPSQSVFDGESIVRVSRGGVSETLTLNRIIAASQNYVALVENEYANLAALLAGQGDQTQGAVQFVEDARTDAEVTAGDPIYFGYYEYLGSTNGVVALDYRLMGSDEVLNLLNEPTFKLFTVNLNQEAATTSVGVGFVDVQYENVGSKVTNILFDHKFSKYLAGMATLDSDGDFAIQIYNKTQNVFLGEYGVSFSVVNTDYYKVTLPQENILNTALASGDVLLIEFNYYNASGGGGGGGTVTSVAVSGTDGIEVDSGSPITSSGTIQLGVNKTSLKNHLDLHEVNLFDFLTDTTTRTKILTNDETHDAAIVKTAFDSAITYCKTNGIKKMRVPSGTYMIDKVTINNLSYFYLEGDGAIFKNATGDAIFEYTQCERWGIKGITFDSNDVAYADVIFNRVSTDSGFFNFIDCTFKNMPRAGIRAASLAGGTFTYGIQVTLCHFLETTNHSNVNQCGVELAGDGEYSKIHHNIFQGIPSAIRFVDGANGEFSYNTCMGMNGDAYTTSYLNGIVFCANGSNSGKIDILYNKINHNDSGMVAIVCKGDATKPQNPFRVMGNDILVNNNGTKTKAVYFENAPNSIFTHNKLRGNAASPNDTAVTIKDSDGLIYDSNYLNYYANGVELVTSERVKIGNKNVFENISTNEFVIDTTSLDVDCDEIAFSISGYGSDVDVSDTTPIWLTHKIWLVNYQLTAGVAPDGGTIDVGFKAGGVSKVSADASIASTSNNSFSGTHPTLTQNKFDKGAKLEFPITVASGTTAKGQDVKVYLKIIKI